MPYITQGPLRMYYETHGQGDPLILIRGFGSNADHWYAQVPQLARHYQVITFDNRGVARSSDPGGPFTIEDMAQDTAALMEGLQIGPAHVLGLSLCGMVAQELAIRNPQLVKGLILVVTHCGGELHEPADREVLQAFQRLLDTGSPEARAEAFAYLYAPRTFREKPEVVQAYLAASQKYPAALEVLRKQWAAVQGHDACGRLQQIASYTLLLTGSEDVLVPPVNSTLMAERISRSELIIIPGGGHQVLIEEPGICNQAMIDFLRKVDDRDSSVKF